MIHHALFPTLVAEWNYSENEKFKSAFLEHALSHFSNGYSMETTGDVDIHLNDHFIELFNFVANSAKEYVDSIGQDSSVFAFNIVKTWLNVTKEFHTPIHNHADAHLSFVYYVNTPSEYNKPIYFVNEFKPNHLFYGMTNADSKQYTPYNSDSWFFEPKAGHLFMFPGKLYHYTSGYGSGVPDKPVFTVDELLDRRVAIAGDILLTYKTKMPRAYGIMPVSNWKSYE